MIKHSIRIQDLHEAGTRILFNKVVDLFVAESHATGLGERALILEDFGTTLVQNAWTDDTGWYCVYRMHPAYVQSRDLREADARMPELFAKIFGKPAGTVAIEDPNDLSSRRTITVHGGTYSIGD